MEGQIQKGEGDRGIGLEAREAEGPSPWQHSGVRGKSQVSLPPTAPIPCEHGSVTGEACPVRHVTLRGSALAGLKLKILQEASTGQKLLLKERSYLCPADPLVFPALRQEQPRTSEGEEG